MNFLTLVIVVFSALVVGGQNDDKGYFSDNQLIDWLINYVQSIEDKAKVPLIVTVAVLSCLLAFGVVIVVFVFIYQDRKYKLLMKKYNQRVSFYYKFADLSHIFLRNKTAILADAFILPDCILFWWC